MQLQGSSICRIPPNRANGIAVFKSSPIQYNKYIYSMISPSRQQFVAMSSIPRMTLQSRIDSEFCMVLKTILVKYHSHNVELVLNQR